MRYRALDANGDYQFGRSGVFLVDSPEAVAQAILTRMNLWTGEWFLDTTSGMPWLGAVVGAGTQGTRDQAIKQRILDTVGVVSIDEYSSSVNRDRKMTVTARVTTLYGSTSLTFGA